MGRNGSVGGDHRIAVLHPRNLALAVDDKQPIEATFRELEEVIEVAVRLDGHASPPSSA